MTILLFILSLTFDKFNKKAPMNFNKYVNFLQP